MANIVEKVLGGHLAEGEMVPGQPIAIRIDQTLTQDATGTMAYLQFEALGGVPELRAHFVGFHRTMRADMARFVRRGLRDGSIVPGVSPKAEAAAVVGSLRGIGYQWLLDPDEIDPQTAIG